jgi:hypothetical protein
MVYNVGQYREFIGSYFFESDDFSNIHIYTSKGMEYLDMLEFDCIYDHDDFMFQCNQWLQKNKK